MKLIIIGIRGIPAAHGGFETFAEKLSLYLVSNGWNVKVYCQSYDPSQDEPIRDLWRGIERIHISTKFPGSLGTMDFDWKCIRHALQDTDGLVLTLGYNTAAFCLPMRLRGMHNIINMDGIEWARAKWSWPARVWFWLNERAGCWLGNQLVADHPAIADHLATRVDRRKITTIAYGADPVHDAPVTPLLSLGLQPGCYSTVIARPEPENSVLEIVKAFSSRARGHKLVMLGKYDPGHNAFHRKVLDAAGPEVIFPGSIYDKAVLASLRFHSLLYIHGHQVGGTNPSLVEALGAGSAVLAHDNRFNRWVAGQAGRYFASVESCDALLSELLADDAQIAQMRLASRARFEEAFTWDRVLGQYEELLLAWLPR